MAEEQLLFDGERPAVKKDVWMMRGDTRELVFAHDLGASTSIKEARFEAETNDTTATTVISFTLADQASQWDFSTDDECTVTLIATNTATLDVDTYRYAVELIDQSDRVYTAVFGLLDLNEDVVDNSGSSPYPSWTTLSDVQTDISQIAACADISWLTTAIAGGEGTIYVENGAIFTAGDDIRVVLDSGAYEDDTIAAGGVSGNTLTLSATIAGAAAIGNVVRIL